MFTGSSSGLTIHGCDGNRECDDLDERRDVITKEHTRGVTSSQSTREV